MRGNKKAVIVKVELELRVIIDDNLDMDIDNEEVNKILLDKINTRVEEEGASYIGENITDYDDDLENPYDPEFDS